MIFTFRIVTSGGGAVTIAHGGDSEGWTNIVVSTTATAVALYSDGRKWFIFTNAASN